MYESCIFALQYVRFSLLRPFCLKNHQQTENATNKSVICQNATDQSVLFSGRCFTI